MLRLNPAEIADLKRRLGEHIRARRLLAGLSQAKLAETAGVSLSLVRRTEAGQSDLRLDDLERFARALGCLATDLLPDVWAMIATAISGRSA